MTAASPPQASGGTTTPVGALLRIQVVAARNLIAKDRNGKSDPFVVLSLPTAAQSSSSSVSLRRTTPVKPKTLDPVWTDAEGTFELPIPTAWIADIAPDAVEGSDSADTPVQTDKNPLETGPAVHIESPSPIAEAAPDAPFGRRPGMGSRSASRLKITAAASKRALGASVRVMRRGTSRPMRLRRNGSGSPAAHRLSGPLGNLEFVLWDKDRFSNNDYLGECSLAIFEWCLGEGKNPDWEKAQPFWVPLVSSRVNTKASGELQLRIGFVPPSAGSRLDTPAPFSAEKIYEHLTLACADVEDGASVLNVPASLSVGTAGRSEAFVDDGMDSDGESGDEDVLTDDEAGAVTDGEDDEHYQSVTGVPPALELPTTPTSEQPAGKPKRLLFGRRKQSSRPPTSDSPVQEGRKAKRRARKDYAFKAEMGKDIIGIVMMEVRGASDLPRWKNVTHTGFDMDPLVIISFAEKIFRTRVARHTLNPVWDEKLLFHVRRHESNFQAKFSIYDWDKMSSNDHVGDASLLVSELIEAAEKPDPATGLYSPEPAQSHDMKTFTLPLTVGDKAQSASKAHQPILTVDAKFTPYAALRQRLWRQLLRQYDSNDSGTISQLELTTLLDSLGSTLTTQTVESYFEGVGEDDELEFDQAIIALEREIAKPLSEKRLSKVGGMLDSGVNSGAQTPNLDSEIKSPLFDMVGSDAPARSEQDLATSALPTTLGSMSMVDASPPASATTVFSFGKEAANTDVTSSDSGQLLPKPKRGASNSTSDSQQSGSGSGESDSVERVVMLKTCPMCHMSNMNKKAEVDIITHLAVCASQDWRRVENMVVSNFVTASQAHRKWYMKMITKVSQGNYSLGADSANIIVQDRRTGELQEEKMQVYVRLGIRLLYRGAKSRMDGARIKKMLKNMSVKQGVKFDSPSSAREIAPFIAFHSLDVNEILDPIDSFKTFNEFFYRKLKPDARPVDSPDDSTVLVSGADCRMMAFSSVQDATRLWIKGRDFSIESLLGGACPLDAQAAMQAGVPPIEAYKGGALCIFRLAPQDYHRFHVPADAVVGDFKWIDGEYYTVNPMAVRSSIDIYCENIRVIVPFHSEQFGTFYAVCIGAMMVGSTVLTVKTGDTVKRGQEFGYFKFGGSTIVLVFENGRVELDDDLLANSQRAVETLVRVGMHIGKAIAPS